MTAAGVLEAQAKQYRYFKLRFVLTAAAHGLMAVLLCATLAAVV